MTAVALEHSVPAAPKRIWNVVRLHVANPLATLVVPWAITAAIFILNMAIFLIVVQAAGGAENLEPDAFQYSGGITWIVWFMTVVAVQAMNLTFSFALGFAVTRRDFYLGSALYFVLLSVMYATGLTLMAAIEKATGGWGIDAAFFAPWGLQDESVLTLWFLYLCTMLLFFFLGAAVATVWVRWKAYGLYAFFVGLAAILVVAAWLITTTESWGDVGEFLTTTPLPWLAAATLPLTAVCGVAGYVFLRRATPKS
ncbi:ABC transporter permease [Demequina litorisediminis]|uniref:ABC transporter permease n=1 Tax=Demequina litorisediminis TaxID=1849022 RepID=A0ABQ6IFS8_9MICO|nr:ABC transporter permease [Demequina litorisediminis]GMA36762.1 hypothetical protein GCM10025876_29660 [Demequina litorisediminis]